MSSFFCKAACPIDTINDVQRPRQTIGTGAVDAGACVCARDFYMNVEKDQCNECVKGTDCQQAGIQ